MMISHRYVKYNHAVPVSIGYMLVQLHPSVFKHVLDIEKTAEFFPSVSPAVQSNDAVSVAANEHGIFGMFLQGPHIT